MYENADQRPAGVQQIPAEQLEHCYLNEELQPLLVDEFEDGNELSMEITEECETDDEEEQLEGETDSGATFALMLQEKGLQLVEETPNEELSLLKRRIAFKWSPPFGWSIGYVEGHADANDREDGYRYSVRYGDTIYPQALSPQDCAFGEDAPAGSWALLMRRQA